MKLETSLVSLALLLTVTLHAAPLRDELNLAGKDWQEAIADTLDLAKVPGGLDWQPAAVPVGSLWNKLKSADNQWSYCTVPPEKYFNPDGTFKVKEKLSAWYKKSVDIPAALLENRGVHLTIAGASFKSAVFVDGQQAGESIQSAVPLDFDLTKFVKPGQNELVIAITTREGLIDPKAQVYLAPSMGATAGVRGPIRLEFRPLVAVEDVFVKTSVAKKNIDFQTTVKNSSTTGVEVTPTIKVRSLRDPEQVVGEFTGRPLKLAPGAETVTDIKADWVAPILWSPSAPEMYTANVTLLQDGKAIDSYQQTFGFREFTTKGKDFLLNGKRFVMLRDSSLNALKTLEDNPDEISITQKAFPVNSIRQHLGCYNMDLIHRANQQGILVVPESAYSWTHIYPHAPDKAKVWLPGVLDYYQRWARHLRNEPSVVLYSLVNETYWTRDLPEEMAVCKQIVDLMRREDPTRPLQGDGENSWNGLLDVINIHYPEGAAGTLRLQYPNAGLTVPNDLEWLTPEGGKGWQSNFKWDRPLVLGEFGGGGDAESYSSHGGDDVYNWVKWEKNPSNGPSFGASDKGRASCFVEVLRKMINHYRHVGVAGLNPWDGDKNELLKAMVIAPLDFHPNVEAGGVFKRQLAAFNDEKRTLNKIKFTLTVDGALVCDSERPCYLEPGQKWSGEIAIPVPLVDHGAKAEFMARLIWTRGKQDVEVDRHVETVYIIPKADLSRLSRDVASIDPKHSLDTAFQELNLATNPEGKKLLVVGVDGYNEGMGGKLDKFVEDGGVVLMLPQKNWKPYRVELPERDSLHAATQAWVRQPHHPALQGMDEAQFSFWGADNVVSRETFKKPQQGPLNVLLDCGGRYGMSWSPLLEIPLGKGAYLMTTLELTKAEPGARRLLANLVEYGCARQPVSHERLNLLAGNNAALAEALKLTGVQTAKGVGDAGPVLVDASADFALDDLKAALAQGRTVWLHGFTPETLPKVAALLPPDAKLSPVPKDRVEAMPLANDPLVAGVANYDLLWHIPESWQGPRSVIAKIGDWTLDTNLFVQGAKPLTTPAFLVKVPYGKGTILFDTLQWERGLGKVTDKSLRLASTLLTNLDCGFKFGKKATFLYSFVDLAKFANMGYLDSKADDGVGGWTDQGRNDMRFFLINHAGTGDGEEGGMAVPVPPFPTKADFDGVPYQLVDPKANGGKAVLSFGSAEHAPKLPRQAGPIPVNGKADRLWFLHALAWATAKPGEPVAEYTVEYEDGTTTTIPIRCAVDAGDWHNVGQFSNAAIAWRGRNLVASTVGLNAMAWNNPHPEKAIKSLTLKAGLTEAQYVLVAITRGVADVPKPPLLSLDFSKPLPAGLCHQSTPPPVQTPDGLAFAHGSNLVLDPGKAGLRDFLKQPFSLSFAMTPTAKPDGYCAGLVETGPFRVTLSQGSMKVTVETFGHDGKRLYLSSHDPVELNRRVEFEYLSDGKRAVLRRDGKIDAIADAPLPNRETSQIRFGVAGGKDYNFNGVLHRFAVCSL